MNPYPPADDSFLERALRYQDGALSAEEIAALEMEMLGSEEKRRAFAAMQMQSMLLNEVLRREAYAPPAAEAVVPFAANTKSKSLLRRFRWAFAAAAALAITLVVFQLLRRESEPSKGSRDSLARITYDDGGEWEGERQPQNNLLPGGTFSLVSGTVRLKFEHDDTVATLAGPARFDLLPPGHIRLHEGRLSARVSQPDKGFTVHTDALTVLDRGTVFGVDVRPDGEAVVSVLEGTVDVSEPGSKEMQRLEQGGRVSARPKGKRIVQPADDGAPSGFEDLWPLTLGVDRLSHLVEFVVPRAKHKWQEYRSDTRLYLMPERQRVQPDGPLSVDILPGVPVGFKKKEKEPRTTHTLPLPPSGRVNSYLLFFRPLEDAKERRPAIRGSITFAQPIVGIISDSALLQITDETLGHPRVHYRDKPRRGIEAFKKPAERDVVHISKDGRRLFFNLHADPDEFRVLVAAP